MDITNLPLSPLVDKSGMINIDWRNSLQQIVIQLQNNLSNEKYRLPQQPGIAAPTDMPVPSILASQENLGAVLHNTQNNAPAFNLQQYTANQTMNAYAFVPGSTFHTFATMDDLMSVPANMINGKFATVATTPNVLYIGTGAPGTAGAWQQITTAAL